MRSFGSEILSIAVVLSVPLGIVSVFPFGVLGFRAKEVAPRPVRTAFVTMTPEAERAAMRAARVSWRARVGDARRLRADLFCVELPEDERMSVLSLRDRSRPPSLPQVTCEITPFLPSQKAPPPSPIAAGPETDTSAFPREELLKMN